ncbi:hypothetical protein COY52_11425 [Candidatus Desantisbacteria bacterium CG_4_10_14_0_8_um_filter_48_22]|uniref:Major facilitator superfamily (MFS) profile domain-containing protein n=1 Tax=Candidatus Desantisbacteria bacterium CG_4_10_14_0_8_um_filter_48_22 TaxID=1974543 RepID=A0A2M7S558_9BACT|nr:MAG: hypothetical protein AUJ67_06890 [Candidatus Desantisbacteria bacterium CG1_02_49_89]PIV54966.1 MAG: hypothetical protein COS16_08730 [Candidatus Desantisbacteria bacterium CG02_land_8_20_14_3_00_49_13]PIZ14685.1 MAG: hypothetical protein COY52_11425 [Candidatus Desantisbacteria bacterium CG_4_10_14_0_8_um_filter_48_22]PJB27354.1 MAG: hypothetical protein CO111_05775 [Candidatus Desantisbacteria bacterium CG_4_9_14_3_um_filter_50_7]
MSRNVKVLLLISVIFGLALGIYEFIFPLYLNDMHISFRNMGIIFSLSSIAMFFIRIHAGQLADVHGRKKFYSLALLGSGLASLFTPFTLRISLQTVLKSLREACAVVQESIHSVALYENVKSKFLDFIGKTVGAQWVFQGLGALVAGGMLVFFGYRNIFLFNAGLLFSAFLIFTIFFSEKDFKKSDPSAAVPFRKLYALDFSRPMMIIMLSSFVFNIGMGSSHSFIMPLFFLDKFAISKGAVSIVMAVHRLTLGLPMIFAGWFINEKMNLKRIYIWFIALEGIMMAASALIPNFFIATAVWLAHDYVGAAFWSPVSKTLIQRYSRQESRAYDVSKVAAFSTLGLIIGPLIAGWLAGISISAPFFAAGMIMIVSALMLVPL